MHENYKDFVVVVVVDIEWLLKIDLVLLSINDEIIVVEFVIDLTMNFLHYYSYLIEKINVHDLRVSSQMIEYKEENFDELTIALHNL
jgi:hypothetical protein